jgi:hypothetical protein
MYGKANLAIAGHATRNCFGLPALKAAFVSLPN